MKIVTLFPGQGAQYPGMGKSFYDAYPLSREVFEEASDFLKKDLVELIFHGDNHELMRTKNCQVALFVVSLAIFRVVKTLFSDLSFLGSAGLSLGEYSALASLHTASFEEILQIVKERGRLMDEVCEKSQGTMAALLGFTSQEAEELVKATHLPEELFIANYNAPGQIVLSGTKRALEKAKALFSRIDEKVRTKKMVFLDVHGAFHSGLMKETEEKLSPFIESTPFTLPTSLFVMNVTAKPPESVEEMRSLLKSQVSHAVRWEESIRFLETFAPDLYIECGPGKVLGSFNKRIGVKAPTVSIEKIEDLKKLESLI